MNIIFFCQLVKTKDIIAFKSIVKTDLASVRYCMYTNTQDRSLFTRYQKRTAMYNWSPYSPATPFILFIQGKSIEYIFAQSFTEIKKFAMLCIVFDFILTCKENFSPLRLFLQFSNNLNISFLKMYF